MVTESPVEEFVVRGRRVLVKRDDKVVDSRACVCGGGDSGLCMVGEV